MSILNCFLDQGGSRALIATDSAATVTGGVLTHISKLLPLPHINAVVAGRGNTAFLVLAHGKALFSSPDFDALLEWMPKILADASQELAKLVASHPGYFEGLPDPEEQAVLLVGYSKARGRIIGRTYHQMKRADGFLQGELGTVYRAPFDDSIADAPYPDSDVNMVSPGARADALVAGEMPGVPSRRQARGRAVARRALDVARNPLRSRLKWRRFPTGASRSFATSATRTPTRRGCCGDGGGAMDFRRRTRESGIPYRPPNGFARAGPQD